MSTLAKTAAGTRFYIGARNPTSDIEAAKTDTTWVEVAEITNFGEFGRNYNVVTHEPVGDRKTYKLKGGYNEGAIALQMARAPSDQGQARLRLALDDDAAYNCKILYGGDDGSPAEDSYQIFPGKIFSYTTNPGARDNVIGASVNVEIDGEIYEPDPEPAP